MESLKDPALDDAARTNFANVTMQSSLGRRFYLWLVSCDERKAKYDAMDGNAKKTWRKDWLQSKYDSIQESRSKLMQTIHEDERLGEWMNFDAMIQAEGGLGMNPRAVIAGCMNIARSCIEAGPKR
eukprot:9471571-Pyramimonas_sp.AAC.1